jgi:epoxyqueuosine reductase
MIRNALIAAGNSRDPVLVRSVAALLDDAAPVVRGTAVWALRRLAPDRWLAERQSRSAVETDGAVAEEWAEQHGG